ncbi:hypothetical protein PV08_09918 [Exophiala spinifera]|uniref:BZIP domain-containing protein n=1 Tax=Exophiala spinifera TaxID=91928 RepID=A0A0D2B211_9EURO|nr:uncharacterized protein PV08_09918 [Exophiala spinifera]KIW12640.1 hypothetical protein PV08_09918 [Exophiala spinifera]
MEGSSSSKPAKVPPQTKRGINESRAERKRVQDRLAQRATRERTRSRIAFLEQRLKSLEAADRQGEIVSLTRIIEDLRNENHRLRDALLKMRSTIDETIASTSGTSSSTSPLFESAATPTAAHCNSPPSHQRRHPSGGDGGSQDHRLETSPSASFEFNPDTLLQMFETAGSTFNAWGQMATTSSSASPFDFRVATPPEVVNNIAPDVDKWHVSNGAFINALTEIRKRNPADQELDLHVPFKAAIWGWNNVGPEAQHPVWLALRQVDQRVFGTWKSKAQRIALMYVCQTLMQYRENPTADNLGRVPEFLRPRPSQEKIQHPAVIDFLIWPALRDRLVFEYKKYTSTGIFSKAFVENFNFYWPYPARDIFIYDPATDGYDVSPMFLRHVYDLKNWTMKPAFFKQFPEMENDIPVFTEPSDDDEVSGESWTI